MSDIVARLRSDHVNMLALLTVLDEQLGKVANTKNTDFEIMRDVVNYLCRYSDAIHHPTEDLVYGMLADRSANVRSDLAPIPAEHVRIEQQSRELLDIVDHIADGEIVLRTTILEKGQAYVIALRRHIELEEKHLFPMIPRLLDDDDLKTVQKILDANRDPVFGEIVDADFQNLYEHIQNAI